MELIGWIGAICFAISAAPQAYQCISQGHAIGINGMFLFLCITGEILTLIYVLPTGKVPLLANYIANLFFLAIIVYFKYKDRRSSVKSKKK